ncbi:hypothetical protein [Saccharothrix deserti]|uniref:hypothetical protein n=1 Tax=Saccharothrix deserti TaxID=2593674 RepID=UPI00131B804E|nr:hypothetical protein [Saccharothrix deserti]
MLVRFTTAADGSDATPGRTDMSRRSGSGAPPEGWDVIVDLAGTPRTPNCWPRPGTDDRHRSHRETGRAPSSPVEHVACASRYRFVGGL